MRRILAAALLMASGPPAGVAKVNPDAAAPVKIAHGPVRMPAGVDFPDCSWSTRRA